MKKRFFNNKYLLPVILFIISYTLNAQDAPLTGNAPITTAVSAIACPSSTISIPFTVTGFTGVGAFSLRIEYDHSVMTFNNGVPNSLLQGTFFSSSTPIGPGTIWKVSISWDNINAPQLADGSTAFTLGFNYINGTTSVHFNNDTANGNFCQFASSLADTLIDHPTSTYYHDGLVSSGVVGGSVSPNSNFTIGTSTGTLTLSGYIGNVIKWQKQFNGGGYIDITPFNNTPTYSATPDTTGVWNYRAVVQYGSCAQAFSTPVTDTVTAVNHAKTWTGAASTNWKNSLNWNPYGIPLLRENVTIPTGLSRYPIVSNQGLGCNNLTVGTAATLNINSGIHLTINGTLNILGP
jgi:hypothetical protein